MKAFKISGKFQRYNRWSDLKNDFVGYFTMENGGVRFSGYMEEKYKTPLNPLRYITGKYYNGENKIYFLKLSQDVIVPPLLYVFPNSNADGIWSTYDVKTSKWSDAFFTFGKYDGFSKVRIEKVKDDVDYIIDKTIELKEKIINSENLINIDLLDEIDHYEIYLGTKIPRNY